MEYMEEIKLPKFKTKEGLEQFVMGLMTENESLKNVIKRKDSTIKELDATADKCIKDKFMADKSISAMKGIINDRDKYISELESEIESLKEKPSKDKYEELYDKERIEHAATKIKCMSSEYELNNIKGKVHNLCSMVTFMFGLLPRFKTKRVKDAFGEFNAADYRI